MTTSGQTGMPAKVLVVEDEPVVRDLLVAVMRTEGYDIVAAADADTELRQARALRPHLDLIDVLLGSGPDGFTVARRLRGEADVALLIMTLAEEAEVIRA